MVNPGGLEDKIDDRDYPYEGFLGYLSDTPLPESYDTELVFGKITQKDQEKTYSCGGQATAYYAEMLELIENKELLEMSPRSIYAFTGYPNFGSTTRDNVMRLVNTGIAPEDKYSSQPMTEEHVLDKSGWTPEIEKLANKYKAKIGANILDRTNFDIFKSAIFDGHGVISGLNLSAEGWHSNPIRPPQTGEKIGGHIMYFKGWGTDQFGEYILLKDSYPSGDKRIYRDYFSANMVHSAWVLIDEPNIGDDMDLIKKWLIGFYRAVGWTWGESAWSEARQKAIQDNPETEGHNFGVATKNNLGQLVEGWKQKLIEFISKL